MGSPFGTPPNLPKFMPKRPENALPKPRKLRNSLVVYADKKRIVFGNYDDTATWKKFSDFCQKRQNGENETPSTSASSPTSGGYPPNGTSGKPVLIADLVTQFLESAKKNKSKSDFSKLQDCRSSVVAVQRFAYRRIRCLPVTTGTRRIRQSRLRSNAL